MNGVPPGENSTMRHTLPLPRADIIVAHDKALALRLGGGTFGIVDWHLVSRPDLTTRDAGPARRYGAGQLFVSGDDRLAVGIVPGDDTAYAECHRRSPSEKPQPRRKPG